MDTIRLGEVTIVMGEDETGRFLCTQFPDGYELLARPIPTEPEHAFDDPWTQCWTHEVLHSMWAASQGLRWSPALRFAVTREATEEDLCKIREEETIVLGLQQNMATSL